MARTVRTPGGKRTQPIRPYSDDKKTKGRRTGQTVKAVARDEDDFEDFDELFRVNEPQLPLRPVVSPRGGRISALENERSGLGSDEMSIVEDPMDPPSPSAYVASLSRAPPSSVSHLSSLSRRVDRSRITNFDAIPSPTPSSGPTRLSYRTSSDLSRSFNTSRPRPKLNSISAARRSSLNLAPQEITPDSETEPMDMNDYAASIDGLSSPEQVASPSKSVLSRKSRKSSPPAPNYNSDSDNAPVTIPSPTASPPVSTSRPRSRAYNISDAEDDQASIRNSHKAKPKRTPRSYVSPHGEKDDVRSPKKDKGKAREVLERTSYSDDPALDDEELEDDRRPMQVDEDHVSVARHVMNKEKSRVNRSKKVLSPVEEEEEGHPVEYDAPGELSDVGDDDAREEEAPPEQKKRKTRSSPKKKKIKPKPIPVESTTYNEEGLRRGTRKRFKPLEYWRGEKLIIGRSANGPAPCPIVKALYQLPPETHEPLGVAGRKRKRQARSQSASRPPPSKRLNEDTNDLVPPEEGWDAETPLYAPTIDYDTGEEVVRRVACTAANMNPAEMPSGPFAYQKIFMDGDFIASGIMTLPVDGRKPLKSTRDNTYVFFCHAGAVRARIHKESHILAPGSTFLVPRGNQYEITNISKRESVLFFAQARMIMGEEFETGEPSRPGSTARSSVPSVARSSFAGTPTEHVKGSKSRTNTATPIHLPTDVELTKPPKTNRGGRGRSRGSRGSGSGSRRM